jgi:UDP-N-acetylmuramoyl-L-alanyl-D-glutamate--2,6-diaminopimelate ligase
MTRGAISAVGQRSAFNVRAIDALGARFERLALDSRKVKPGDLFLAYPGQRADGRAHIGQAIAAGATAVLWERDGFQWSTAWQVPNLGVADLRSQVGDIASHFFGNPSGDMWLAGVTGTNGKTSCSHWIAQSLTRLGRISRETGRHGQHHAGRTLPAVDAGRFARQRGNGLRNGGVLARHRPGPHQRY